MVQTYTVPCLNDRQDKRIATRSQFLDLQIVLTEVTAMEEELVFGSSYHQSSRYVFAKKRRKNTARNNHTVKLT